MGTGMEKRSHHKKGCGRKAGSTEKTSRSSRTGPKLSARAPGQDSVIIIIVQDTAFFLCSSGKLCILFCEFTLLLAGVFLHSRNCAALELTLTQPPSPTHISPALLLWQVPNNVFLRRHSPRSCFPKTRTVAQGIIKQFSRTWSLGWGRKWQRKEKGLDVDAISNMKTNNILNLAIQRTIQNSCSLNIQLKHYLLWVGGLAKLECSETLQMPMGMTKSS